MILRPTVYLYPNYNYRLRRFLSYLLLALAAFQCGASLLLPLAQVGMARTRADGRLRSETAHKETFVLSRPDFLRNRSGQREWWHNGLLYDLKSLEVQGDSVRIVALPDAQEQWLLAGFQRFFGANTNRSPTANPLARLLVQLLAQPFLPADHAWILSPPAVLDFFRPDYRYERQPLAGFARIFSPPPDLYRL